VSISEMELAQGGSEFENLLKSRLYRQASRLALMSLLLVVAIWPIRLLLLNNLLPSGLIDLGDSLVAEWLGVSGLPPLAFIIGISFFSCAIPCCIYFYLLSSTIKHSILQVDLALPIPRRKIIHKLFAIGCIRGVTIPLLDFLLNTGHTLISMVSSQSSIDLPFPSILLMNAYYLLMVGLGILVFYLHCCTLCWFFIKSEIFTTNLLLALAISSMLILGVIALVSTGVYEMLLRKLIVG
jgi:hypothetical protein